MRRTRADVGRAAASTLIAALGGVIVWFAGYSAGLVDASALWALVLLVGVVGLGCGIGHLLVRRGPAFRRRAAVWLAWSACAVAVALPFGALLGAVFARHMSIAPLSFLVLAAAEALAAGLLIGHSAALQTHFGVALRALVAAATGLLHGYAFGLAYGVAWLALYRPVCAPHTYCLEPGPLLGIHSGLIVGPIAGLALGIIAALALAVAYGTRRPTVPSRRAATT
ncbi:MAG TPA: hypothetical protein VJQ45_10635 [Ktedonobacterales bacterium]|nr:hypothetical protein [Ktedonobacterales bacterium]